MPRGPVRVLVTDSVRPARLPFGIEPQSLRLEFWGPGSYPLFEQTLGLAMQL